MRILFIVILSILSITTFSQKTVIQFDKGSIAYLGLKNPISIMVENTNCKDILINSAHGKIERDSNDFCKYYYRPLSLGYDTLRIFKKNKNDSLVLLENRIVNVNDIPLEAHIMGGLDSTIEKKYLVKFQYRFEVKPIFCDFKVLIDSFDIYIKRNGKFIFTGHYSTKENLDTLYKTFQSLESGDELFFNEIYYFEFETKHKCLPLKYIIK